MKYLRARYDRACKREEDQSEAHLGLIFRTVGGYRIITVRFCLRKAQP